jgi:D-serine deaminase-like pyridoxal phosphate-dependent protein
MKQVAHPLPPRLTERLRALRERPVEPVEKGAATPGLTAEPLTAGRLAAARPPLHAAGFTYPLLTLRETALAGNIEAMAAYCAGAGVELAPHGKTAMSPELGARQLAHGAWGITVATIGQLRTYRAFGFGRLLLANELVDEAGIAWLAAELAADPGFEAYCYVDSPEGVAILDRVLTRYPAGRRLPVLVEIGHERGRTGCRTDEQALAVARAAAATGTLRVAGVAGYEGSIGSPGDAQALGLVTAFCRRLRDLAGRLGDSRPAAGRLDEGQLGEGERLIVSAGGSAFFDIVTRELTTGTGEVTVILRSGAYVTHDHGLYGAGTPASRGAADAPALRPALELWAQVLSRPEPGLALLGAGRRDVGFDAGLPVPLRAVRRGSAGGDGRGWGGGSDLAGSQVTELNDQHAYLRFDQGLRFDEGVRFDERLRLGEGLRPDQDTGLAPGDLVSLGISHPCTTLDKWRVIPVVSDDDHVTDMVHAFF